MDLDQLYEDFKRLINDLSPEEMQRETDLEIQQEMHLRIKWITCREEWPTGIRFPRMAEVFPHQSQG